MANDFSPRIPLNRDAKAVPVVLVGTTGTPLGGAAEASEAYIGRVGGTPARITATLTRPTPDTTTYTAGDVISDSATVPTVLTFTNVNRATGKGGLIVAATLIDSGNPATKGPFELWLFNTAPAAQNDNTAFAPSDAELLNLIAIFSFTTAYVGLATAGTGNSVYFSDVVNRPFVATARDFYGLMVVRGAVIPLAAESYTFVLHLYQD